MTENNTLEKVTIFDTTLRDGEQAPGCSMNLAQKIQVAGALKDLGVDVIELGFPMASPGDFEAVSTISREIDGPVMCALARASKEDIDRTWEALKGASKNRVHIFLATSPIHREYKLKMSKEEVVKRATEAIAYAKQRFSDIEFSCEDAARTELDFLSEVVERAIEAGAATINIPDTVGYGMPVQFGGIIAHLKRTVRGIDKAVISVHCHNDLGLAVANSLAAVQEGARQVECTINGLGERAGNCSMEEVVMAIRTRADYLKVRTGIRTERLYPTSRIVSKVTGMHVQRNKAVVGQNAFAHEAGIHQHGMLMNALTYEIMRPEDVGFKSTNLVLGKHSGRHLLRQRLKDLGYHLDQEQLDKVFEEFKILADKKKEVYDGDLEALVQGYFEGHQGGEWQLVTLSIMSGSHGLPGAAVSLKHRDGRVVQEAAVGDGPIDAIFKAMERVTGISVKLSDYQVSSVSMGEDAQGEVKVEVEYKGRTYRGRDVSTDIVMGSAKAFLEVVNQISANAHALPRQKVVGV